MEGRASLSHHYALWEHWVNVLFLLNSGEAELPPAGDSSAEVMIPDMSF